MPHLVDTVAALGERGVQFRSLTEHIDTTTAGGELVFHIFAALAQMERRIISERTLAGLEAARARGRVGGRPTVMTPDKLEAAQRLVEARVPITKIAASLGVGRATVSRALRPQPNPAPTSPADLELRR